MSKLTRRSLLAASLVAGLAACGGEPRPSGSSASPTGSGSATPGADADTLVVGLTYVPDIQFAPLYVAESQGWFVEEGLDVTLRHHGAQESLLGALQTEDEHVVFAGGGEMLQGRGQGIPVINFATAFQQYPVTIIVPEDSPIQSLADLRGHSIGLPGEFGENWFYLLAVLADAGLSPTDIDIQSIGFTQHAALTGDKVDSVVGYLNNDVVRFGEAGFAIRTLQLADPPLVSVGLGTLDQTLADRPEELSGLVRAMARGAELCSSDPERAVQISQAYVANLAEEEQRAAALATLKATTELFGDRFGRQDVDRWQRMAEFFVEQDLVDTPVPADEAFTTSIVD